MKRFAVFFLSVILVSSFITGCNSPSESGLLHGIVSIGPLIPVEQPGQSTITSCDAYDVRKIMIYDKTCETLIRQVDIDCSIEEQTAGYSVELAPGIYTVDINRIGIDTSIDVPVQVEIISGQTTRLDIAIDTGIR